MKKHHAKLAEEFYDKIIKLHHKEFHYEYLQYVKWLDLLASKLSKEAVVLDLGCGNGRALKYFVDKGFQGIGIDISDKMLKLARKYVPKARFYKKEFTQINFNPNSIDAVISFFALNHIPKTEFKKTMNICKKILKKYGILLLGMVKGESEGLFKGFYGKKMELYGAGYSMSEIIKVLKLSKFRILKTGIEHFKGKYFEEDDVYVLAKKIN
ncbi:class I SAM-dependent methyltransferase [Candidatus Woesearchaeota archaeon]|nr:class I SAM-dependent methyltransferase [Candidatus Woesearchaeota archaeon]